MITTYANTTTPESEAQSKKEFQEGLKKALSKKTEIGDRLLKHIGKYITSWWD